MFNFSNPAKDSGQIKSLAKNRAEEGLEEVFNTLKQFRSVAVDTSGKKEGERLEHALKSMRVLSELKDKVESLVDKGHQELASLFIRGNGIPEQCAQEYCWHVDWQKVQDAIEDLQSQVEEASAKAYEHRRQSHASATV